MSIEHNILFKNNSYSTNTINLFSHTTIKTLQHCKAAAAVDKNILYIKIYSFISHINYCILFTKDVFLLVLEIILVYSHFTIRRSGKIE